MSAFWIVFLIAVGAAAWVFAGWYSRRHRAHRCIYCGAIAGKSHLPGCRGIGV